MRCLIALAVALVIAAPVAAQSCPAPDNINSVAGGGECLVIHSFGAGGRGAPVLVVVLHGDVSAGGPATYHLGTARRIASPGAVVAVAMIRPGYDDGTAASTGTHNNRRDHYTAATADAIAVAVAALRRHHRARRVVLVGHSGGAALAAQIMGRHAGIAEAAVLVACPCDTRAWRAGRGAWPNSVSPIDVAPGIAADAMIIALTGSADDNTRPALARAYVEVLVARGVRAEFVEIPGATHNGAFTAPQVDQAIRSAIAGR